MIDEKKMIKKLKNRIDNILINMIVLVCRLSKNSYICCRLKLKNRQKERNNEYPVNRVECAGE